MHVNLFMLCSYTAGGYRTYVRHLIKSLEQFGHTAKLYRVYKRPYKEPKPYIEDIVFHSVKLEDAVSIAKENPSIIAGGYWKSHEEAIRALIPHCRLVVHSGQELREEAIHIANKEGAGIIANRKEAADYMASEGIESTYLPYPHIQVGPSDVEREINAISLCRPVWVKNMDIIVEANRHLSDMDEAVRMYGGKGDSRYVYHKLRTVDENWDRLYMGTFGDNDAYDSVRLASKANYVVDLTVWEHDGGGVQFVFMEAFDAEAVLIVHRDWLYDGDDEITEKTAVPVSNAEELVKVLKTNPEVYEDRVDAGLEILDRHRPEVVVPMYEDYLSI